ncbi:family 16 glycosylhydrolase [Streptomyces sp. NPDC001288]|uniref:family 16 glycosylhydrolase n=1 Tax=unclassified Streptomyces TaxID=2593676 RepID=UPI0033172C4C
MRARRNPVRTALTAAACALLTVLPTSAGIAAAAGDPAPAAAAAAQPDLSLYTERFQDEFNAGSVDTSVWGYRTDHRVHSCNLPGNVSTSGGSLVVDLKQETVTCPADGKSEQWTGGGLISKKKFGFGYYEARVRMPASPGWHSAFWTMCGNTSDLGNSCRKTEIDGFESESGNPAQLRHNIFDWGSNGAEVTSGMYSPSALDPAGFGGFSTADWHTYGFLYDETGVTYYIDGKPVPQSQNVATGGKIGYTASKHQAGLANIWLTGIMYEAPNASTAPGQLLFDYVRYYEKDRYLDNDESAFGTYTESGPGWGTSGVANSGFAQSSARFSCSAGATAQWSTQALAPGQYTAWIYTVGGTGSDTAAKLTYSNAGGVQSQTTVNQATAPAGWQQIGGTYTLGTGTQTVKLESSGNGCLRADAVKFVRTG